MSKLLGQYDLAGSKLPVLGSNWLELTLSAAPSIFGHPKFEQHLSMSFFVGRLNMELEITWPRIFKVWWAYLWRSVLAILAAMVSGAVLGFIVTIGWAAMGFEMEAIKPMTTAIGVAVGLGFSLLPIKMILGKQFGDFKLALVRTESA